MGKLKQKHFKQTTKNVVDVYLFLFLLFEQCCYAASSYCITTNNLQTTKYATPSMGLVGVENCISEGQ